MKELVVRADYRRPREARQAGSGGNYPRPHIDGQVVRSFLEQHRVAAAGPDVELATSLACKACDTHLRIGDIQ